MKTLLRFAVIVNLFFLAHGITYMIKTNFALNSFVWMAVLVGTLHMLRKAARAMPTTWQMLRTVRGFVTTQRAALKDRVVQASPAERVVTDFSVRPIRKTAPVA